MTFHSDHMMDVEGRRWALACPWDWRNIELFAALEIPAFLNIPAPARAKAWEGVVITRSVQEQYQEDWRERNQAIKEAKEARLAERRAAAKAKYDGLKWDRASKRWVSAELPPTVMRGERGQLPENWGGWDAASAPAKKVPRSDPNK